MSLDTPYIDYTAFSAHCQPSFSNNLQRIDHLLKLFPFDLEPVAVHNEPARVRVHKIQHLLIIMQRPPFKRTVLIKGGRSLLPPSPTTRLPGSGTGETEKRPDSTKLYERKKHDIQLSSDNFRNHS